MIENKDPPTGKPLSQKESLSITHAAPLQDAGVTARRPLDFRECVSTDRDEELSDVQDSDEEEHYGRSERRFGYNPDNGEPWAEYQAVMGDDLFAW